MTTHDSNLTPPGPLPGQPTPWLEKVAKLAYQNWQARMNLVEHVARERRFKHLDEEIGNDPGKYPKVFQAVAQSYADGGYFLRHLALFFEVTPTLSLLVFHLRQEWIRQYDLQTVPELMLVDQAMLAFFHMLRLNRQVANMLALTEGQLFFPEAPHVKIRQQQGLSREFDGFVAEEAIKKLQERLMPLIERFNTMFLRNLRALQELKASPISINIGQASQVNVGQDQLNLSQHLQGQSP